MPVGGPSGASDPNSVAGRYPERMAWYDVFARFYDRSLEKHYAVQRKAAVECLCLEPGMTVLAYGHPRWPAIASLLRHHPKTTLILPIRIIQAFHLF